MNFIYQNPDWPHLVWDAAALSTLLGAVRFHEGLLLGRMQALGFELCSEAVLRTVSTDVITTSAIEGESLDPRQVRSSVARRLGMDAGGHITIGKDVDGIVELMMDATGNYQEPLSAERLCNWHSALFPAGRSGIRPITVGAWRRDEKGPMQVLSGPMGKEKVHYQAPPAHLLDQEMTKFLEWINREDGTDGIIRAGLAHFFFVTIHPFDDGNGRIARAIADMMLARADGSSRRFYSMSARIAAERNEYYRHLEQQQKGSLDVTPWLDWFLRCLDRSFKTAEKTLGDVLFKARVHKAMSVRPAGEREHKVIDRMLDNFKGPMTTSKYARIAKCSTDTALRDIRDLVSHGILLRNPEGGRSTSYRLAGKEDEILQ
jgi:Fic family protein